MFELSSIKTSSYVTQMDIWHLTSSTFMHDLGARLEVVTIFRICN